MQCKVIPRAGQGEPGQSTPFNVYIYIVCTSGHKYIRQYFVHFFAAVDVSGFSLALEAF